ncbi:MAG: hypothetical protein ACYTHJ_12730 [Planctomycetota bacterium]
MTKPRTMQYMRRLAALSSAGVLFQATGCTVDATGLFTQLVTLFGTNIINSLIFGAFNLTP